MGPWVCAAEDMLNANRLIEPAWSLGKKIKIPEKKLDERFLWKHIYCVLCGDGLCLEMVIAAC